MKATTKEGRKEGMKIFVVDDNKLFLSSLVRNLTDNLDCTVTGFTSAEDCLEKVDDEPSLIISDFYLDSGTHEHMNGDRLLSMLRQTHSEIPVVIYSGQPSVDVAAKTMELGAKDYLAKDENGFEKIAQTSALILKTLKLEYKRRVERNAMFGVSTLILLFVTATLIISNVRPDYLFPFFITSLSLAVLVSVINFFLPDIRRKFHMNSFRTE